MEIIIFFVIFFTVIAGLIGLLIYLRLKNKRPSVMKTEYTETRVPLRKALSYWLLSAVGIIGFIVYSAIKSKLGTGIVIDIIIYAICLWLASFAWNIHIKLHKQTNNRIKLLAFKKEKVSSDS